jgi:hypothetical protein
VLAKLVVAVLVIAPDSRLLEGAVHPLDLSVEGALLPLRHPLRVEVVAPGELFDRSLRSLYRRSDDVRGLGAAVKYLSHRAPGMWDRHD